MSNNCNCIYLDTEWSSQDDVLFVQVLYKSKIFVYFNPRRIDVKALLHHKYKDVGSDGNIRWGKGVVLIPHKLESGSVAKTFFKKHAPEVIGVEVNFFYSPRDLLYFFGEEIREFFSKKIKIGQPFVTQQNNIKGSFPYKVADGRTIKITLFDLYGLSMKKGLKDFSKSVNVTNPMEDDGDIKLNMSQFELNFQTLEGAEKAIKYVIADVIILRDTKKGIVKNFNNILKELSLNYKFTMSNLPSSTGKIVSIIVKIFLEKNLLGGEEILKLLNKKWAIKQNFDEHNLPISGITTGASINTFITLYGNTTGIYNAIISGGRTINEQQCEFVKEKVFDIDIAGCYSIALREFFYPLGIPMVYHTTKEEKKITLRTFLKRYRDQLVNNLYTITVSGNLPFDQSLLMSNIVTPTMINNRDLSVDEMKELTGDFVLFKNRLENTILTSDILEALEKICTNQELKAVYDYIVITAAFYPKDKEVSIDEFERIMKKLDSKQTYRTIKTKNHTEGLLDSRPRYWCRIPMKDIMDPLISLRNEKKNLIKKGIDVEENKAADLSIKNITNPIYGVIASIYFDVNNTIVANNITARARLGVWSAGRVLKSIQSITDGFFYQPNEIYQMKDDNRRKPGLETLSSFSKLKFHRKIKSVSLCNKKWDELIQIDDIILDNEVEDHLTKFWAFYGLKIPYKFEHKTEHKGSKLFYIKKAHYSLLTINGKIIHKYRGVGSEREGAIYHRIAENILLGKEFKLKSLEENESRLSKISDYLKSIKFFQVLRLRRN